MKRICIVGMGWLGKELAVALKKKGFTVTGTTSTESKLSDLKRVVDKVELFDLNGKGQKVEGEFDFIVYTVPPSSSSAYAELSSELIQKMSKTNPKAAWVYTSSTSVYGNDEREVAENSEVEPQSDSAKKIVQVEQYLKSHTENWSVVRFGGLVGGARHPVKYLAGRTGISKPLSPVNLLHREDAVYAIVHLIEHFKAGIYNLCSDGHPRKKDYYNQVAKENNFTKIEFDEEDFSRDKVVTCSAIKKIGFEFKYTSPYEFQFEP